VRFDAPQHVPSVHGLISKGRCLLWLVSWIAHLIMQYLQL
jgi:hypothetical protein